METLKQIYLLQMRKACAEIESLNQCAARETAQFGAWNRDWEGGMRIASSEFQQALDALKALPDWDK